MEPTQIALVALSLCAILGLAYLALRRPAAEPAWVRKTKQNLAQLSKRAQTTDQLAMASTLIDSDKLLDYALKQRGLKGETMGARLKSAKKLYSKDLYNAVWEAHKVRNQLVHEMDYKLTVTEGKLHFYHFKRAIGGVLVP